nr:sulfite exporter TauE/SafE family protein [uncultured Rhodopila sp.]
MHDLLIAVLIGGVSLLYATAGQAGGTAFLAVMAFAAFPAALMRPTALLLNVVAAGYATWRLHRNAAIDWPLLLKVTVPSLATAFLGGLVVLSGQLYFVLTGVLLVAAAVLMIFKRSADTVETTSIRLFPAILVGGGAGLVSGLTGVGGGVFLTPLLIAFGWASPRVAARLSPPFILCNSVLGLGGVLLAGQIPAPGTWLYGIGALAGAVCGTALGHRRMSEQRTRQVLAAILLFAGVRLLYR